MSGDPSATQREPDIVVELAASGFDEAVEIGRGGFGVVYRCLQSDLDRTVAVKVLTSDLDPENLARFVREQRAMGRMSGHPHIVDLHQVGVTGQGRPFLVMPYHAHGSLDAQIRRAGPLGWQEVLRLGVKIAGALETAHRGGTLHRDVKPANILLTDYDEPQLADFGIARIVGGFETTSGSITGSPAFTAPEVLEGRPPTVASDLYSLGATLFCALTGHAAFERHSGEHLVAQFLRISSAPIPDLRDAGIPDDVCAAIEHAMTRQVDERPTDAASFGNHLREIQGRHGLLVDALQIPTQAPLAHLDRDLDVQAASAPHQHRPAHLAHPTRTPPSPVTKFRPPTTTRRLVRRHRLLEELRSRRDSRLILVHGPAGFGKSSLVAQWRDELLKNGVAVAWLTVDQDDNNEVWFLSHLVEAIGRVRSDVVGELGQVLEENGQAVERFVLTSLINRLHDSDRPVVIVIDDWHRIAAAETISALEFLLDNGCHHLRLVVASRSRTGLPLSRMRVRDELHEIDATSLSFDVAESREFFADRLPTPLTDSDIELLQASTDGWIAALQLAALTLREQRRVGGSTEYGRPSPALLEQFRSGTDTLDEYLAENVLDVLEPDMLDFLLATAVPARVCGDLATMLTGVSDGQAGLDNIVARDLFLGRSGDDRQWYRYHHLFLRVLRKRLERGDPRRMAQLHRTASEWFRERHMLGEALDHVLAAGDQASAVALIEAESLYLLSRSQMSTLLALIAKLPHDLVAASPRLQLATGWANAELQQIDMARESRRRALALLGAIDLPADRRTQMRIEANVLQAGIESALDHTAGVKDLVAECVERAPDQPPFVVSMAALIDTIVDVYEFRFDDAYRRQIWAAPYHSRAVGPYAVAYGYCYSGLAKAEQLDITAAVQQYHQAFDLVQRAGNAQSQHARLTRALLAEVHYLQNRIPDAEALLSETSNVMVLGGSPDFMIRHCCLNARILALRGDLAGAANELDAGADTADTLSLRRLRAAVETERVRIGLPPRPEFVPATRRFEPAQGSGIEQMTSQLEDEAAIILLARSGNREDMGLACDWADDWVDALTGTGRELALLYATRLLVSCLWARGRKTDATTAILPLAITCARHGLVRLLPDGGPHVIEAFSALCDEKPSLLTKSFTAEVASAVVLG
ncbi:serine/threonine-protein kinase [Rhodococcus sp. NCIMB 12038]|uniref:serine/threonine-protein kinase n=1 Tax=Rhodococcus sp. NCIMB 12038 TaxID=933800 RepID=UPI000B3C4D02|nr:serine/threonine-protein kinase [Rhodococcus sp. NCIMB 12038]OUS83503.1 protein kinase [Rhodococcus sp. NCIMB 12038]